MKHIKWGRIFLSALLVISVCALAGCTTPEAAEADTVSMNVSISEFFSDFLESSPADFEDGQDISAYTSDNIDVEIIIQHDIVQTARETPLISNTSDYAINEILPAGISFSVTEAETPLWIQVTEEGGERNGYLFADDLYLVYDDGTLSTKSYSTFLFSEKLAVLKEEFPQDLYWNHIGYDVDYDNDFHDYVTDTPCNHSEFGYIYCNHYDGTTYSHFSQYDTLTQCLGFASLISDDVFGADAPIYEYSTFSNLRLGDHIRLHDYEHSMTVIEISEEYVVVGEVNENYENCQIDWSRRIDNRELENLSWDITYFTRYPIFRDVNGSLLISGDKLDVLS